MKHISEAGSFLSSSKEASNLVGPLRSSYSQSVGKIRTVNLLRYAPGNRSGPSVVTGKRLL